MVALPPGRSKKRRLVLAVLAVLVGLVLFIALGGGTGVFAAGPERLGTSVLGVGPGGELAASDSPGASSTAASQTRSSIAVPEVAAGTPKAPVRSKPRVRGRVVDRAGVGIPGARVWITTSEFWAKIPLDLEVEALPTRWMKVERAECDGEGRFGFDDLEPGAIRLAARSATCAPAYREDLEALRETDVALPDVVLEPGVVVAGVVLAPDGKPAPGVRVLIAASSLSRGGGIAVPGRGASAGATDELGRFRVDELAAGPFQLLFLAEGLAITELSGRTERAGEVKDGFVVRLEHGVEIAGRITPKSGPAPAGLRIVARRSAPDEDEDSEDADADAALPDAPEFEARPRTAFAAADGSFRIGGLRSGESYRLTLTVRRGEAWKAAGSTGAKVVRAPNSGVDLPFEPETAILLRVVDDATSLPLEDFVLWAGPGRFRALRDEKGEVQHAFPLGAARYGDLRLNQVAKPGWLRVSAAGYQDFERKDLTLTAGRELDIGEVRLKSERKTVVTVVDAAGAPVENARVVMTTQTRERLEQWSDVPLTLDVLGELEARSARTNAEGRCVLSSYPGKNVLVQAGARGFTPSEVVAALLSKEADHAIALKLERGARVVVRVTDGGRQPVAGVPVGHRLPRRSADEGEDRFAENLVTDPRGEARFEALEPGVHAFRIQQEDGESSWWEDDSGAEAREEPWQELVLASAAEAALVLVAPPRGTLFGVVREGGRPLEGAVVKLVPYVEGRESGWTWGGNGDDPFSATTDHRGEYRLLNRRSGPYVALVHHADRRMASELRVVLGTGEQAQDFLLDQNAIHGRVTDPEGRPLVGVQVGVSRNEAGIQMEPPHSVVLSEDDRGNPNVEWRQARGGREARTDTQGQYVLRGLIENAPLVVAAQGDEVENKALEPITLAPGEIRGGADLVLRRASRVRVEIAGNLSDDRWYEVAFVSKSGDTETVARQAWLGKWNTSETVGSIVPGIYVVRLTMRDQQGGETRISETPLEVELGKVARLDLRVP